jgi:translation initiation factor IF-3
MLSTAMMVYALVCVYQDGINLRNSLWMSGGIILCALSYYNAYGYIVSCILLFLLSFLQKKENGGYFYDWKNMLKYGCLIAGVVLAGIGWWFIRSYIVLDLVKIAPTAKPPVCKIVDYGKYKYEQVRKEKEAKKKQKVIDIKEIRLSPNIDTNDLNTKIGAARKFLTKGDRVKITLRFRGREMAHMNNSKHILDDIAQSLSDIAVVEKAPKVEGRSMTMFLTEKR